MPQQPDGEAALPAATPAHALVCPSCGARMSGGLRFCPTDGARLLVAEPEGARDAQARPSLVGTVLAERYRIVRKVGEGGMGEVYEARHVFIDKRFAIKTLRPEVGLNPEAIARFQQEAHAASTIGHENIVDIEDFGQLPGGAVYMAMEFLEGGSLAARARSANPEPLPRGEILDVFLQVCAGLEAAHEKGIIHRDMKPENVFLTRRGEGTVVKILDFGIAKVQRAGTSGSASGPQLTHTGAVFGTPFYMSPEQALGQPLDGRTDVYSVGVMLYELFAGRVPFEGDSFMAILSQHITMKPTPPSQLALEFGRSVPLPFEQLILRAMAKERDQRFATMRALAEALREAERCAVAGTPDVPAPSPSGAASPIAREPPVPEVDEVARHPWRRPALWLAGALALVAALAAAAVLARGRSPRGAAGGEAAPAMAAGSRPTSGRGDGKGSSVLHVIVDSEPGGARIVRDGQVVDETPAVVKVPVAGTVEITLRREGYLDRRLVLDGARSARKVMVKLEREPRSNARPAARPAAPQPAIHVRPDPAPPPAPRAPSAPPPTPAPRSAPLDPYED